LFVRTPVQQRIFFEQKDLFGFKTIVDINFCTTILFPQRFRNICVGRYRKLLKRYFSKVHNSLCYIRRQTKPGMNLLAGHSSVSDLRSDFPTDVCGVFVCVLWVCVWVWRRMFDHIVHLQQLHINFGATQIGITNGNTPDGRDHAGATSTSFRSDARDAAGNSTGGDCAGKAGGGSCVMREDHGVDSDNDWQHFQHNRGSGVNNYYHDFGMQFSMSNGEMQVRLFCQGCRVDGHAGSWCAERWATQKYNGKE